MNQQDSDTGVTWTNESVFVNGRLYQRRVSELGTMFDVRCVFREDPEGITDLAPLQLFKVGLHKQTNKHDDNKRAITIRKAKLGLKCSLFNLQ